MSATLSQSKSPRFLEGRRGRRRRPAHRLLSAREQQARSRHHRRRKLNACIHIGTDDIVTFDDPQSPKWAREP